MRNLSTEFKEEQNNGNHRYLKFVDITLKNGTELHLDNSNLWSNGFSFEEAVSSGDNFDIGAAIINKFSVAINNIEETFSEYVFSGAKAVVYVGLKLSTGIEKIRICTGTVSEEPKQKSSIINLTLLDNMSKFDRDYADVKTIFPSTRNQVVRDICSVCGVTLQTVKFDHDDFIIQSRPDNEALTCRQMLAWVAQIGCQWAKCDEYGRLCIEWYKDISLDSNNLINIKSITNMSVDLEDVIITGVKVTEYIENPSEDNPVKTYMYGKEGYVLSIAENKLITENTGNTIASIIGEKCVGMRFRPFSLNCITDISIEAGDAVKVTDRKGKVFLSYVTNVKLQPGNYEAISCGAESAERNSAKQYSLLTQVEVAARKNIQKEKTEREKALEELAGRLENSPGVFTTVETDTGGGKIYYLHNKPKLSDSDMVWKMTAEAWAVSTDGGKTWNAGMTVDGDTIVRILNAVGVNADWIETGSITVRDSNGDIIFSVDMDAKSVIISGDAVRIGGRPVKDVIDSGIAESKNYSDKKLSDYANTVSKDLEKIQSQVDGQVEDWYFDYEPSMQNIPASQWTTTEERQKHIGDRFFWKSKGYAYRFMEDNGVWGWTLLQDTDITKAMQTAQSAKDIADGKRRTFVTTPQPPYDIGDLWTDGKDILTCVTARENGALYVSTDWEKLNDYTDDTVANQALEEAKKAHNLTISLDNDYQGIPSDHNGNITDFPTVKTHVTVFYGHDDVSASCTYSIQKASSIAGSWDNTRREYTVTGLSSDTGWVDITANYMQLFTVTKRFNVAKNKDGAPGANGTSVTIVSKSVTYQVGASGTQKPIGEWEEAIPQVPAGQYLWTKTYVKYSDGNSTESYTVSYKATDGTNGDPGISVTITSKSVTYQASASGTTPPTGEWKTSVPSVTKGQYLWTRTVVNYSDGTSTTSYSVGYQGTNGADGSPGRTYFMELSSLVVKQSKDNTISPNYITMSAFYRDGTNTARTPYAGRFKIEESTDGNTWKTVYTSSENESSVRHSLYSVLSTQSGGAITTASERSIGIPRDVVALRCTLYAAGGTTQMLDTQSAAVVLDVDALTHEEIFNLLTKNGEIKGIYQEGNQLYISFTYAKGGTLTLGGIGNGNGTLKILNASGAQVGYIDNTGVHFNQGEFSGTLKAATGTFKGKLEAATGSFSGNLNAGVGGTIGGWKIGGDYIQSTDGSLTLYSDGRVKFDGSVLRSNGSGMSIKYGLELYTNSGGDFSDGTDGFRIHGLGSLSGRTLVLNSDKYVGLSASSSRRYKDHIRNMSEEEALALMDVPVVWFRYKDGYLNKDDDLNGKEIPGFYAENIADSMRELAIFNSDGSVEDWNYRTVIPVMEKQIQILNKKMEDIMKKCNDNTKM